MKKTLAIASYFLLVGSLLPEDITAQYIPEIFSDWDEKPRCVIGHKHCNDIIGILQSYMTHILNQKRSFIVEGEQNSPIATNMLRMEDDEELKYHAQQYAEECVRKYGHPENCPPPDDAETDGDVSVSIKRHNIRTTPMSMGKRLISIVNEWGTNPRKITPQFVRSFAPAQVEKSFLDFAKLSHAKVSKVGCGMADFFYTEEDFEEIVICFYGAPKLRVGEELYRVGSTPCSNCPSEAPCESEGTFKGLLCRETKMTTTEAKEPPVSIGPPYSASEVVESKKVIWRCNLNGNTEFCAVERSCAPYWTIDRTGGFMYIKVSEKCVTATAFKEVIVAGEPCCFKFQYKKEGEPSLSVAVGAFASLFSMSTMQSTVVNKNEDGSGWTNIYLNIPSNYDKVQVGIVVYSSYTSGGKQIIKVRDFEVSAGRCS